MFLSQQMKKIKIVFFVSSFLTIAMIITLRYWILEINESLFWFYKLNTGTGTGTVNCPPVPGNNFLNYENSLCLNSHGPISNEVPAQWKCQCPHAPIVTVKQMGRLGNQMWAYASAWAVAKKTGREAYVPNCIINTLSKLFQNIQVPPLSYIAHCKIQNLPVHLKNDEELEKRNGNIILPDYVQMPEHVVPFISEIRQVFKFKDNLVENSQKVLQKASNGKSNVVFVGVHVRRGDYKQYLINKHKMELLGSDYFSRQMNYFRTKHKAVIFVVVSDDPNWCERNLSGDDVVVMRNNSPEQDMAIMASCNHSILDYGTFGYWGAILSGGETLLYKNYSGTGIELSALLPNWHLVI